MQFIFLSVNNDAPNYVNEKLQALITRTQEHSHKLLAQEPHILKNALQQLQNEAPEIASKEAFFETTKEQRTLVEIAQRCAIQDLVESAPLIDGEEIEEDFFSYLLEPFHDTPKYTAVLKRTTNKAQILYIFNLVKIDEGNLRHLPPSEPVTSGTPNMVLTGLSFTITSKMITGLLKTAGKKAVSAGLSKLGAIVLNIVIKEVFGVDDTQKLIDEVKKIIKEEIETNEITKIEGVVTGTLQFLSIEYRNQKEKTDLSVVANRKALMSDLKSYSNKFYTDVIGLLKQDKYATRGLRTFMLAAPVHLLLTQEMALVDPEYMDPNESGYLKTLRDNATNYRTHVYNSYHNALNKRNNMEVFTKNFTDCMGNACVHKTTYHWRDNVSGESTGEIMGTKDPKKSASERAHESLERHRTSVLNTLKENLGHPQQTFLDHIGELERYTFPKS